MPPLQVGQRCNSIAIKNNNNNKGVHYEFLIKE